MNGATTPTLVAIFVQLGLGVAVFYANPARKSNQCFLVLSLTTSAWLASLYWAFSARTVGSAEFWIRQASATGVIYFPALDLLRLSILRKRENWSGLLYRSRIWLALTVGVVVLCQ